MNKNSTVNNTAKRNSKVQATRVEELERSNSNSDGKFEFQLSVTEDYSKNMQSIIEEVNADSMVEDKEEEILSRFEDQDFFPDELSYNRKNGDRSKDLNDQIWDAVRREDYGAELEYVAITDSYFNGLGEANTVEEALQLVKSVEVVYMVEVGYSMDVVARTKMVENVSNVLKFETELHTGNYEKSEPKE